MSKTYKVKNWHEFQHFKDRNPPWIKLHRSILERRDISAISDCSFRLLIMLWVLASEDKQKDGGLPSVDDIAFRTRLPKQRVINGLEELKDFLIQSDIAVISNGYRCDVPETETEGEKERESELESTQVKPVTKRRVIKLADETEWLNEIRKIYHPLGVDVDTQLAKARAWLLGPKGKGRKFTQQYFINWLSRADTTVAPEFSQQASDYERENREACERMNALMSEVGESESAKCR